MRKIKALKPLIVGLMGTSTLGIALAGCYSFVQFGLSPVNGNPRGLPVSCTNCQSDSPGTSDTCTGLLPPGAGGTYCSPGVVAVTYTIRTRHMVAGVCVSCDETTGTSYLTKQVYGYPDLCFDLGTGGAGGSG